MKKLKWTKEQSLAINLEGTNLIISAGAGSGKTAVLSERVLRKLKEGIDIRRILILTFTNEAAGEMKERIRKKIAAAGLTEQLLYIDSAYITTFDAYAFSIVKKYHYLFNLSSNISIIDSSIINLEKKRLLEEIIMDLYEKKDSNYLKLVGDFTVRDDTLVKEAILNISNALDLKYDKTEYLKSYIDVYYRGYYIDQLFQEYVAYLTTLTELIEADYYALEAYLSDKVRVKCYEAVSAIFKPRNYDDLYGKNINLPQFRGLESDAKEIKEDLKALVDEFNELTKYSEEELKKQIKSTKDYVCAIIDVILKLDEKIHAYKKEKAAFEFTDIAKMAIWLVKEHKSIREELRASYQEIMIDEYQDTNDLQEMFIGLIENNNVYMVGDIKQSIYRFRNANPRIFKEKYERYKNQVDGKKIDLLENFRSRREVLANINEIFKRIMIPDLGGVDYSEAHAMIYGNMAYEEKGRSNESHDLELLKYQNDDKTFSNAEIEAFIIAKDILDKVSSHYPVFDFDLGANKDATYKDFCIILDRGSDMPLYKKIFEYFNIPMEVYKDSNLTSADDIRIINNIVRLILAIYKEEYDTNMRYYFVSIARSFVGGMDDEEIFAALKENTFYETEIYKKASEIAKRLDLMSPGMLLREIIEKFSFYQKLILVGNVSDAIIRLDYLESLATSMETIGFTIEDFAEYLSQMIDKNFEIRYREARSKSDCVKIMNIHKSKGLEFPICYFAGLKKNFNLKDLQARFMFDPTYGILTPFYEDGIGTTFTKQLIKNKYLEEEIAEKIRLFYVALTRAKEKIIMVLPEFKTQNKVSVKIDYLAEIKFRSFYDFLNSMALNLAEYSKTIDLNSLELTKDYERSKVKFVKAMESQEVINFRDLHLNDKEISQKHASKAIESILSIDDAKTLKFGTQVHEMLEETDFKNTINPNKYVRHLLDTFDFQNATIYQELEFMFTKDDQEYHGIIDLMLEYDAEIKIIDYKLKNIDDDAYVKQLNVYYEYMRSVTSKNISLYLYSIIDNKVKEVEVIGL